MVAVAAEYRIKSKHGTSPYECVRDGKSAIRFLRANAKKLGIDPNRLAAGGGSAGGHVAATTATVTAFNQKDEDTTVSCVPNALVLFNPVYDNGPEGYGQSRVKERWREFSPMHNIRKGIPPAIVFLGTNDKLIPVKTGEKFRDKMRAVGSRSELFLYEDQPHGFFNFGNSNNKFYVQTVIGSCRNWTSTIAFACVATRFETA
jgi:acetyl esterase/lipase